MPLRDFQFVRSVRHEHSQVTARLLIRSYAPDWLLTIFLSGVFLSLNYIPGYKREFSLDDKTIQYTFAIHERVPDYALYIIAVIAPLMLMPLVNSFTIASAWDIHTSSLGLILSLGLTGSVTQISKVTVGRPRPDLIDRCQPQPGSSDHPVFGLSNVSICTQTDGFMIEDGFRSFPSGHSSISFAGLGFLAFYLAGKLHLWDRAGHTAKAWISIVPLMGATLVAISRTMDNRHHWEDVVVGSSLGFLMAYFSYRQYYPPLSSLKSHVPYPPRVTSLRPSLVTEDAAYSDEAHGRESLEEQGVGLRDVEEGGH